MSEEDLSSPVRDLRYRDDRDAMCRIAAGLREIAEEFPSHGDSKGKHALLWFLAILIDPDRRPLYGAKLVVRRTAAGSPKSKPNSWPGFYMWAHVDVLDEKVEAVVAGVRERYGLGRSAAMASLAKTRREVHDDKSDHYAYMAELIRLMRDRGVLDSYFQSE